MKSRLSDTQRLNAILRWVKDIERRERWDILPGKLACLHSGRKGIDSCVDLFSHYKKVTK